MTLECLLGSSEFDILFVALPVNKLYPQDIWDGDPQGQLMHLLQAKPELCGVIWGKVSKALLVLDPILVEGHPSIPSLRTLEQSVIQTFSHHLVTVNFISCLSFR